MYFLDKKTGRMNNEKRLVYINRSRTRHIIYKSRHRMYVLHTHTIVIVTAITITIILT
jgi:hypothetical protein